jgi:Protein of unknown function (DUF732)
MFTGTTSHSGALVTTIVVLTGAAILRGGAAAADSNQDDQFLALLDEEGIPAVENVPSLIDTAHKVCRTLDAGMPADGLVDVMVNDAYGIDPTLGRYPRGRLVRTEARFITAAVEAYCPYDQRKIASIMANPAPESNESTHRVAAYTYNAVNSGSDLREPPPALDMSNMPAAWQQPTRTGAVRLPHLLGDGAFASGRYGGNRSACDTLGPVLASLIGAVPSGEVTQPDPPQIPAPPPPAAQIRTPHRPVAAPPPPKQPPPPQQAEPPAVGPQPGDAAGSGGGGSTGGGGNGGGSTGGGGSGSGSTGGNGGGGPAEPPPALPMPPGFVRLAP